MPTVTKLKTDYLVRSPASTKTYERELGEMFASMIRLMGSQYKNQTFLSLDKRIVNKFVDAQSGNFSAVFLGLSESAIKKILKRFTNDRIKSLVSGLLKKVDARNREQLYGRISEVPVLNGDKLLASDGTTEDVNALILESVAWATRLRDSTLQDFTSNTLRAMALGESIDSIESTFDKLVENKVSNGKFLANNQVSNFNSLLTKIRAQKAGISEAFWVTSHDEKVRRCHAVRDGKRFDLSEGLYSSCDGKSLLPGVDYNCRCTYHLIIPTMVAES